MVYVTHDQIEAMTLGDRITVMSVGEIQQVGSPTTVYDFPFNRFVASFIGTPVMNFLEGQVAQAEGGMSFVIANGPSLRLHAAHHDALPGAVGRDTVLGVRPEQLSHGGFTLTSQTATRVEALVAVVENMGDHQYVYLRMPGSAEPVVMKCNSHHRCAAGEKIPVNIDTALAHVFADRSDHARTLTLPKDFKQQQ